MTDGTSPQASDVDIISRRLKAWDHSVPVIFNCQIGVGRSTTGMVVACLLLSHHGKEPSLRLRLNSVRLTDTEMAHVIKHEVHGNSPRSEYSEEPGEEAKEKDDEEEADKRHIKVGGTVFLFERRGVSRGLPGLIGGMRSGTSRWASGS